MDKCKCATIVFESLMVAMTYGDAENHSTLTLRRHGFSASFLKIGDALEMCLLDIKNSLAQTCQTTCNRRLRRLLACTLHTEATKSKSEGNNKDVGMYHRITRDMHRTRIFFSSTQPRNCVLHSEPSEHRRGCGLGCQQPSAATCKL